MALSFKIPMLNFPWLLNGNFNTITSSDEHKGGDFKCYASKSTLLSNFIMDNNLNDLGFSGPRFTWCNA